MLFHWILKKMVSGPCSDSCVLSLFLIFLLIHAFFIFRNQFFYKDILVLSPKLSTIKKATCYFRLLKITHPTCGTRTMVSSWEIFRVMVVLCGLSLSMVHSNFNHTDSICHIILDASDMLLSGSADATVKLWDVQYGKEKLSITNNTAVRAVAIAEGDKEIVYATDARMGFPAMMVIYSLNTKKPLREIAINGSKITTIAWSLQNKFIFTGHEDGTITAWDPMVLCDALAVVFYIIFLF